MCMWYWLAATIAKVYRCVYICINMYKYMFIHIFIPEPFSFEPFLCSTYKDCGGFITYYTYIFMYIHMIHINSYDFIHFIVFNLWRLRRIYNILHIYIYVYTYDTYKFIGQIFILLCLFRNPFHLSLSFVQHMEIAVDLWHIMIQVYMSIYMTCCDLGDYIHMYICIYIYI
jgi:hypothetical protein